MKHRIYGKRLGRDKNQRTALFRGLVRSLVLHESITTTESKAKAIKGLVDKLIAKSKEDSESARRVVYSTVSQPEVSKKLIKEIAPRYKDRTSGFTSIIKLGRRAGDGAMLVKMSLVESDKGTTSGKGTTRITGNKNEAMEENTRDTRGTCKTRDTSANKHIKKEKKA